MLVYKFQNRKRYEPYGDPSCPNSAVLCKDFFQTSFKTVNGTNPMATSYKSSQYDRNLVERVSKP